MLGVPLEQAGDQRAQTQLDADLEFPRGTVQRRESGNRSSEPYHGWDSYQRHIEALSASQELKDKAYELHNPSVSPEVGTRARELHQEAVEAHRHNNPPDPPDPPDLPDSPLRRFGRRAWEAVTGVKLKVWAIGGGVTVAVAVVLVVLLVLVPGLNEAPRGPWPFPRPQPPAPSPGLALGQCSVTSITRGPDNQCIGWITDPASIPAEFELGPVLEQINRENFEVFDAPPAQTPAVTVAYMLPLPTRPSSFSSELRYELEGVVLAQHRYNTRAVTGDLPKIRVIVVNTGQDGQYYPDVLPQLDFQARAGNRVVAAMGLGQSLRPTQELVDQLSARGIAVLPTRATANVLSAAAPDPATGVVAAPSGLVRVAPPNSRLVSVAAREMQRIGADRVALVQDNKPSDPYNIELARAFQAAVAARPGATMLDPLIYDSAQNGLGTAFNASVPQLCEDRPTAVYVAGRGIDIAKFLISVHASVECQTPITVLAGDDGVDVLNQLRRALAEPNEPLERDTDNQDLIDAFQGGKFVFQYTALTHPDLVTTSGPFASALEPFANLDEPVLEEGATLLGYDTATVAMQCIREAATQQTPMPSAQAVLAACRNQQQPIYGATGMLTFDSTGQAIDRPVPIVVVRPDGSAPMLALYRR